MLRRRARRRAISAALAASIVAFASLRAQAWSEQTPADLFQELFVQVQVQGVYPDSKSFPDAVPRVAPEAILADYRRQQQAANFELPSFVSRYFALDEPPGSGFEPRPGESLSEHIDRLWPALTRPPDAPRAYSSRVPLPHPYVVPGGRFREIYYWDSYFTMLGLEESGRADLSAAMLANFAWMIDRHGHVPNGNRTYYLSRSQPPFFALMVALVAEREGDAIYTKYLPQLRREYAFWMDGEQNLSPGQAHRRVVRLADGSVLNRYWDDRETPRDEAYREDVQTARASQRPASEVYRNLRAAAESGWDFSSRWLADGKNLATIRTTELVPPDLNSLLHQLELTIAKACTVTADLPCSSSMESRAAARRATMTRHLWSSAARAFVDYAFRERRQSKAITAATLYPLFVGASSPAQARAVAGTVRAKLLQANGLATTTVHTGQQWDAPNGWAPLQWIAVRGLQRYGQTALAAQIARRWIGVNARVFGATGKLVEKYDLRRTGGGGGGEYPLQDGFGWTNGVLRKLMAMYADASP